MICFHFFIFDQSATAWSFDYTSNKQLWFAFIFLSLINQQQLEYVKVLQRMGCDLLSFFYLWSISNSSPSSPKPVPPAVICFHFFIFDQSATAFRLSIPARLQLWFAFIFLSLINQQQLQHRKRDNHTCCDLLSFFYLWSISNSTFPMMLWSSAAVICFHFFIFDQSVTACAKPTKVIHTLWFAFIFLSLINQQQRRKE